MHAWLFRDDGLTFKYNKRSSSSLASGFRAHACASVFDFCSYISSWGFFFFGNVVDTFDFCRTCIFKRYYTFFFFNVAAIFSFTTKVVCVAVEKCQFKNSTRGKYADTHTRLVCFAII